MTKLTSQKILRILNKATAKRFESGYHGNIWTGAKKDEFHFRPRHSMILFSYELKLIKDAFKKAEIVNYRIVGADVYVQGYQG